VSELSHHLEHQFEDADQQELAATLAMWLFLATEVLLIGPVFIAYLVYRYRWPEAFARGSSELHYWIGFANTGIIMTTSFTMTLGLHAAKLGHNRRVIAFLSATVLLGLCFLAMKGTDYFLEAQDGLVPGINFQTISPEEKGLPPAQQHPRPAQQRLFMLFFFILTAIHALHMTVAICILLVLIVMTWRGHFSAAYHTPIENAGLYWHFVDCIWIMIFTSMYLLRG
jgi:cytochrome c oxidase subunit 3